MEFATITKRVAAHFEIEDLDAIAPRPHGGQCAAAQNRNLPEAAAASAGRDDAAIRAPIDHDAYVTVTTAKELDALDGARAREGHGLRRYRNHLARSHAGGPLRRVAGGGAGRGLLHPLRPSRGRRAGISTGDSGEIVQMREADVLARLKPLLEDDAS